MRSAVGKSLLTVGSCAAVVVAALGLRHYRDDNSPTGGTAQSDSSAVVQKVEFVKPGTVIDRGPPEGWSHLVLKSQPRLSDETKKKVNNLTAKLAVALFTTTTADVKSEKVGDRKKYHLARIGVGAGTACKGRPTVVDPDSEQKLGADLGLLGRAVLSGIHDKQKEIRLVAVSRTAAIFDAPVFMDKNGKHQATTHRYALLVDENSGRLDTLVWRVDRDGKGRNTEAVGKIEWLPPSHSEECELKVDTGEIRLGIATEKTFAVVHIPRGRQQFDLPRGLEAEAAASQLSETQARKLTQALRDLIRK